MQSIFPPLMAALFVTALAFASATILPAAAQEGDPALRTADIAIEGMT